MKVINKILCFLSVLVLCVPLLCFNVSADDTSELTYEEFFLSGGTGDLSGIEILSVDDNKQVSVPDNYFDLPILNEKFALFDVTDSFSRFRCSFSRIFYYFKDSNYDNRDIYYIFRYGKRSDDYYYMTCHISFSPMSLDSNNKIISDSEVFVSYIQYKELPTAHISTWTSSSVYLYGGSNRSTSSSSSLLCNDYVSGHSSTFFTDIQEVYSNCITEYNGNKVSERPKSSTLKGNIDVKLTPEFSIGMDRSIPDSNFGISEDYWSLEVTNNNDFNIQFKCYIIPATGAVNYVSEWSKSDGLKSASEGLPVLVNTEDFVPVVPDETVWMLEKDQWIYSKETENQEDYFKDTPYLVNKPTSNFFVQAGGTFKQVIKWNQLNLNKNQPYQILVTACECPYDRASDIHISLASDDYSQSFKHIIEESYFIVYDDTFSVTNPLYYDSTDTFGGVIANTGSTQVNTDYWKINAIEKDGEIEIRNADYSNGWRLNPDGGADSGTLKEGLFNNLDDISLSDVTKLVQDTGSYLTLVATVFKLFPSWIWILLFAGISGLLVIGVFKMLH